MNVSLRNLGFASVLILLVCIATTQISFAQAEGIEIKPAIIEDRVDPGHTYNFTVRITNISATEKTFFLNAEDIKGLDDSGLPVFANETEVTPYELSAWIQFSESQIVLGPNQTKTIQFTVVVPQDASPGAHFGGLFLDSRPPKQRTTGASVALKVGSIINLRISGESKEQAQLREFSTGNIVYGSATNVDFSARFANLGNVLLRPHGLIEITNMTGAKVGIVKVNESGSGVFPGADKTFAQSWEYDGFAFGRYQAVVSLVYGEDGRQTVSAATSFWVLPLKPILGILGTVFFLLLMLYLFVRMYISRKIREMSGGRAGGNLYTRRNQSPVPRLLIIALALLFLAISFLILLFLMFA